MVLWLSLDQVVGYFRFKIVGLLKQQKGIEWQLTVTIEYV